MDYAVVFNKRPSKDKIYRILITKILVDVIEGILSFIHRRKKYCNYVHRSVIIIENTNWQRDIEESCFLA